jgi:hypothetical protein
MTCAPPKALTCTCDGTVGHKLTCISEGFRAVRKHLYELESNMEGRYDSDVQGISRHADVLEKEVARLLAQKEALAAILRDFVESAPDLEDEDFKALDGREKARRIDEFIESVRQSKGALP